MKHTGLADPGLRLEYRRICRSYLREGSPLLDLELLLPEAAGAPLMNQYYRRFGRCLMRYCAERLLPELPPEAPPMQLRLDHRVRLLTPALLSLTLELRRQDRPFPPAAQFASVWSRESGFPLPLRSFFPKSPLYRQRLRAWLRREALERLGSGYTLYDPMQAERAGRLFDPRNFYASEKGLILFFPPLSLGSAAEGIPEFCLPWDSFSAGKLRLPHLPGRAGDAILGGEADPAEPGRADDR